MLSVAFISWGNFAALLKYMINLWVKSWWATLYFIPSIWALVIASWRWLHPSFSCGGLQAITMEGRRVRDITQLKHPLSSKTLWAWVFLWRDNLVRRENLISQCHEKLPWESILTILSAAILVVNKICNQIVKQNVVPKLEHWVRSVMWAGDGVG